MKIRTLLLSLLIIASVCYAEDKPCATSSVPRTVKLVGHTGTLRILVVYCKFAEDIFTLSPETDLWDPWRTTLPEWTSQTIYPTVQNDYPDPSISGYYKEMSHGNFDVIGDVCPILYTPQHNADFYSIASGRNISWLIREVLEGINSYVNYSNYDNDNDGVVDMIVICFRNAPVVNMDRYAQSQGRSYQGIASLTGVYDYFDASNDPALTPNGPYELNMDGKTIRAGQLTGSGTFQQNIYDPHGQVPIICHEIGHYLFGYAFSGDIHCPNTHHHGLMDTDAGGSVMNGYERELLGWITPTTLTTNQVDRSIGNAVSSDPLTSGNIFKVQSSTGGDYYIENHTGSSFYENSLRPYNGSPTLMMPGNGILITESNPANSSDPIEIKVADGKWNWKTTNGYYNNDPFERDVPNPYNGLSELELTGVWTISKTGDISNRSHPDFKGVQNNYFNISYNQVFSRQSNPSTRPGDNFSIEFKPGSGGSIIFDLNLTNPNNSSPSKPQNLKVAYNSYGLTVLTWASNGESDMASYYVYKAVTSGGEPLASDYTLVSLVTYPATTWTDNERNVGHNGWKAFYRIAAVDADRKISVKSDYSAIDYLYYPPSLISSNTTFSGNVYTDRDVTVNNRVTLTIDPGTVLRFNNTSSLIVNDFGILKAQGTASKKIIFDFVGISLPPAPINRILAGSGSHIDLRNVEVKNAGCGIWASYAHVYVDSCDFHNMYKPFYLMYTFNNKDTIQTSTIRSSSSEAMWLSYGAAYLFNNKISYSNMEGVRMISWSDVDLSRNTIEQNYIGLSSATNSTARLMGHNLLRNNHWNIYATQNGHIEADEGYNTFSLAGSQNARAEWEGRIYADYNYWGQNPPDENKFYVDESSTLYYYNWLASDPGTGSSLPKTGTLSDLRLANKLLGKGEYDNAEKLFKKVIKDKSGENELKDALNGLAACYRRNGIDGFKQYLTDEIKPGLKDTKSDLYRHYLELYTYCLTREGNYDEALDNLKLIRDNYKLEGQVSKELDFQQGFINLVYKDNMGKARSIFEKIKNDYPDIDTKFEVDGLLSAYNSGAFTAIKNGMLKNNMGKIKDNEGKNGNENMPADYDLFQNYPNPFNPTTTISYALPEHSRVELIVYNIMGSEVRAFTLNSQEAGYHNLQWNGRNFNNEPVPSGIYIYRLRAVSYEDGKVFDKSAKMMLLK